MCLQLVFVDKWKKNNSSINFLEASVIFNSSRKKRKKKVRYEDAIVRPGG